MLELICKLSLIKGLIVAEVVYPTSLAMILPFVSTAPIIAVFLTKLRPCVLISFYYSVSLPPI